MPNSGKNKKIVPYKKYSFFNIGTVLFGILFIYMIICVVLYMTSDHITSYEVTEGSLAGNDVYTALALRTEELITAPESGSVTYYAREGSKVGSGGSVCSIDQGGRSQELAQASLEEASLDSEDLSQLREQMAAFANSFQSENFQSVYTFQSDLESMIMDITSEEALANIDASSNISSLLNLYTAPKEGIVVLSTDGYEDKTPKTVTAADFDEKAYEKTNLRLRESVQSGEVLYKLITSEDWSLVVPLDTKTATELADSSSVKFRFQSDGTIFYAAFSILHQEDGYYGVLEIDHSAIRFCTDRFIEIELMLNRSTGLKIPNSAVARKAFYQIPKEYCTYDENSPGEIRIIKESYASDGSAVQRTITAEIYDETEDYYLVDTSLFEEGDCVIMPDSTNRYVVSEVDTLEGVYNINKGYAVFREITILDENEEFCIVESNSDYGLDAHDHIALDASTVNDEDIIVS